MTDPKLASMIERVLAGDRLALARLITQVENRSPGVPALMRTLHAHAREAYVVGITGPPGAGKSTVVDRLTAHLRAEGATVAVVAVDPSSPFTGGAVLGDRIRMQAHSLDPGVFIRSMATRGSLGGLARPTGEVIKLMATAGYAWVLVETVGVGQTELDIMKLADTTVVVLVPESGDAIQTMKAGLMEAADVFLVNKADRAGAHALMAELKFAAHLHDTSPTTRKDVAWEIVVLSAQAQNDVGILELLAEIRRHRVALESSGALESRRRARRRAEFQALLVDELRATLERRLADGDAVAQVVEEVAEGRREPYAAARELLSRPDLLAQP
jgi:LAO/AO transport system kinase